MVPCASLPWPMNLLQGSVLERFRRRGAGRREEEGRGGGRREKSRLRMKWGVNCSWTRWKRPLPSATDGLLGKYLASSGAKLLLSARPLPPWCRRRR